MVRGGEGAGERSREGALGSTLDTALTDHGAYVRVYVVVGSRSGGRSGCAGVAEVRNYTVGEICRNGSLYGMEQPAGL